MSVPITSCLAVDHRGPLLRLQGDTGAWASSEEAAQRSDVKQLGIDLLLKTHRKMGKP